MNKKQLIKTYKKVYSIIGKSTPLTGDCGLLCGRACCQGDEDDGMLLYPGEEHLFNRGRNTKDFSLSNVLLQEGVCEIPGLFVVCQGTCKRKYRPLACRIFPYLPMIDKDDRLHIVKDPRAYGTCPLVLLEDEDFHGMKDQVFIDRLHLAFSHLITIDGIPEFIRAVYENAYQVKSIKDSFYKKITGAD